MEEIVLTARTFTEAVQRTASRLADGGVVAAPTETVYGLMTRWSNADGRERIYRLKARDTSKLLQMLAAGTDAEATGGWVLPDQRLDKLAARFCPGALTIVTPGTEGSVGLRIPDSPFIQAVLKVLGEPLAATSANLSGEPPALGAEEAVAHLQGEPDVLINGGLVRYGSASTVVSLLNPEVELLRKGPISLADILQAINQ